MPDRLTTILLILLILVLIGALPVFGFHSLGYGPAGGIGFILFVIIIVVLLVR